MKNIIFNFDLLVIVFAILLVLSVFTYTLYNIFTTVHNTSNTNVGVFNKLIFKLKYHLLKLSFVGTVSTHVNNSATHTTVVRLSDDDLHSLLDFVFAQSGNSNVISRELLKSLGLHTPTVINYIQSLGYIIF
jgi:hypothetical protein